MSNIFVEVNLEKIDFSSDEFPPEILVLEGYSATNVLVSPNMIDKLHQDILKIKGDWMNFNSRQVRNSFFLTINLLFTSRVLDESQEGLAKEVVSCIESFVKSLEKSEEAIDTFENLDLTFEEDGLIIVVEERGSWGASYEAIELLESENIKFEIIKHEQSRHDCGASGGSEYILFFIANSAISGITWDVLKTMILAKYGLGHVNLFATAIENYQFKSLRKTIAERIAEDHKKLILSNFNKNESGIVMEFIVRNKRKQVTVVCDSNYMIKEMKYGGK